MSDNESLGSFEECVLLAVLQLQGNAYGASVYEALESANKRTNIGSLYVTLGRLEKKGLISSKPGEPTALRGGRAKIYYKIEGSGLQALTNTNEIRNRLRLNLNGGIA